ncbi:MAG: hypothetical protein KDB53_11780 [Planctomycetes bacterium]|nr:hypothetical protein [Planctomycetota bacterium]
MTHEGLRGRVLILDADTGAAVACLRSLARHGLSCDVAGHRPRSLAGASRYRARTLTYPDPRVDAAAFVGSVR